MKLQIGIIVLLLAIFQFSTGYLKPVQTGEARAKGISGYKIAGDVNPEVANLRYLTPQTESAYVYSAIRGTVSRADTITIPGRLEQISWIGGDSAFFRAQSESHNKIIISYAPAGDFIGISHAKIRLQIADKTQKDLDLGGLSTRALEGENEAPLSQILEVLRYPVNIGWKNLANHCRPELQGDEIKNHVFKKAGKGNVEMIPIARYSPDFELAFGYYSLKGDSIARKHAGTLAKAGKFPQHQTLYPDMSAGNTAFDPGDQTIGFYARSPSHVAYTQDTLNKIHYPDHVAHATRIYPLKTSDGKVQPNSFLVCFEEAKNGDYNDYVFIVKNVRPI